MASPAVLAEEPRRHEVADLLRDHAHGRLALTPTRLWIDAYLLSARNYGRTTYDASFLHSSASFRFSRAHSRR